MNEKLERESNEKRGRKRLHIYGKLPCDEDLQTNTLPQNHVKKKYMEKGGGELISVVMMIAYIVCLCTALLFYLTGKEWQWPAFFAVVFLIFSFGLEKKGGMR